MNEQVFKPRGLYALIMEYNPDSQEATEIVDLDTSVAMSAAKDGATGSYFTVNSATTHGEVQMPVAAPLTFPDLEGTTTAQKENAFKKTTTFIEEYSDRRARAVFAAQNPDSSLNIGPPPKQFASRWSDPNHPVNKSGPLGVLTGGKYSRDAKKQEEKQKANLAAGRPGDHGSGGIARRLQEKIYYLMIVNMPSDEELVQAAKLIAQLEEQKKQEKASKT